MYAGIRYCKGVIVCEGVGNEGVLIVDEGVLIVDEGVLIVDEGVLIVDEGVNALAGGRGRQAATCVAKECLLFGFLS